jgi:TonB family protein
MCEGVCDSRSPSRDGPWPVSECMSSASPKNFSILPEAETHEGVVHTVPPALPGAELDLLRDYRDPQQPKYFRAALIGSLGVHALVFLAGIRIPSLLTGQTPQQPQVIEHRTPLYYRPELTQREPNKNKPTERFNLQDLIAPQVQRQQQSASGRRQYVPPNVPKASATVPAVQPKQPEISAEAPKLNAQVTAPPPPGLANGVIAQKVPPPLQTENPFENVGAQPVVKQSQVPLPKTSLPEIVHDLAHGQTSPHLSVSDESPGMNSPSAPGTTAIAGRMGSKVDLQSDPEGVDLKPYLTQILAIVKRNWFTVMPESVRMGTRRGRTVVQFAVNRDGTVAKVVISDYSGSDPLDRAAVAGLSMSNPLPPLPKDFRGGQLRLSFSFDYNLPKMP